MSAEASTVQEPTQSLHDKLKARLSGQSADASHISEPSNEGSEGNQQTDHSKAPSGGVAPAKKPVPAEPAPNEQVEGDDAPDQDPGEAATSDVPDEDDAPFDPASLRSLSELADATGLEVDRLMDLELPTKIDGKSGTARLRDLVKSYQLDGHINQKLATLDTDRKTFESKKVEYERAAQERLVRLDAGVKTLERALMGEFSAVDWQKLQTEDPVRFNSEYVAYQQRYAILQDIAGQIATEQKAVHDKMQADAKGKFDEEFKLLQAKIPEWSDKAKRDKDKAEIVESLKDYGISQQEFESIVDHRQILVARDAAKWRALQKSKPAVLNKVKAAPKLLKPGSTQSRAAKDALADQADRAKLRQSGKVSDAVPALKRRLFGGR